jgi:hypothetical protein
MRALPLFVAVLFVTAPFLGAVGAAPPAESASDTAGSGIRAAGSAATTPAQTQNASAPRSDVDPNVVTIPRDEVARSVIEEESVELGPALEFASQDTSIRLETEAVAERIESTESVDRRQRFLLGELNRIEQQVITLGSTQRDAIQSYSAGQLSTRQFLVELAQVSARANALDDRRERLAQLAEQTSGFSFSSGRLASLERELDTFTGPVRSIARRTLRGDVEPTRFYVATGPQSVVLTTVSGDRYVREVYRGTLRERGTNGLSPEGAVNATARTYPEIWEQKVDYTVFGAGGNYLVQVPYEGGHLSAFVDTGSGAVFKEFQFYDLNRSLADENVTDTKNGLRLTVSRGYPGAPLYINLTDARTGKPVDTNITVGPAENDSTLVGRTGDDGVLWTVTPDYRFTVFAIKGNSVVFVTVDPDEPPSVNNSTLQADVEPTESTDDPSSSAALPPTVGH